MPDSDPIHDNPRDTPNQPAVVKEGEVLRPTADGWLMRAIRTLFGWRAGSVRAVLQVVLDATRVQTLTQLLLAVDIDRVATAEAGHNRAGAVDHLLERTGQRRVERCGGLEPLG